jgi:hypothetical protein
VGGVSIDLFDTPAVEIKRDRWGRPLITPVGGGKAVGYTRASSLGSALEDNYGLTLWKQRMTAIGVASRRDLVLAANASQGDKTKLNDVVNQAMEAAQSSARASIGTSMHSYAEMVDRGQDPGYIPEEFAADLAAYRTLTEPLFEHAAIEQFCVCDELKVAGTPDRVSRLRKDMTAPDDTVIPAGAVLITDEKGLALTTRLPTPTGWTTMAAVQVDDKVFGADGRPCNVTRKSQVKRIGTYIVKFDDASQIVCDVEHLWWVRSGEYNWTPPRAVPVGELAATLRGPRGQRQHRVPVAQPLNLPEADLPIDPYVLGCWLGDGTASNGRITKGRDLFQILTDDGHELGAEFKCHSDQVVTRGVAGLAHKLRLAGLINNKHIPAIYLRSSYAQRLALLQGLMDTDGHWNVTRRRASFHSTDKALALAVEELACSLGQRASFHETTARGFGKTVTSYCVDFRPVDLCPFRLPRKAVGAQELLAEGGRAAKARNRVIVSINPGPDVETACIAVDSPDRTYLCGDHMVPTHNTSGSMNFGAIKFAVQLAVYAHGAAYNPATGDRTPWPGPPRQDWGVIVHCPAGEGIADLYWVNIAAGWELAEMSTQVRKQRTRKDLVVKAAHVAAGDSTTFDPAPDFVELARGALNVPALEQVWFAAAAAGRDSDQLLAACRERKTQLLGGKTA